MGEIAGIGKKSRLKLSRVLTYSKGIIKASDVAKILEITPKQASLLLCYWEKRGWLYRVRRGAYLPIPLASTSSELAIEDPFILATELFAPCYIGGWSAAEYWGFTDQIFQTIVVVTGKHFDRCIQKIGTTTFLLKMVRENNLFGYETEWRQGIQVMISDPTKTIIDILEDPSLGGGIQCAYDLYREYLHSKYFDLEKLISYGSLLGNRTIFKRLGFITEKLVDFQKMDDALLEEHWVLKESSVSSKSFSGLKPKLSKLIEECHSRISKGYSQLDPATPSKRISTKWKLRVPDEFL